jgi:hypothetical protein
LTLLEQLADAKAQLHLLLTGQQARVFVDQNGERVEYTGANRADLKAYVQQLERSVASSRPGPMQVLM